MVAKIAHGSSIYGAIAYNQKKVDRSEGKVIFSQKVIRDFPDGNVSLYNAMKSFEPYLIVNRRTRKPVVHISLNPDPRDVLNEDELCSIACKYMEELGYGGQPYIVYRHDDIERSHLHIVTVNVDGSGVKIDDSFEKMRSMRICRELEIEYNLNKIPEDTLSCNIFLKKVDYSKSNIKGQISNIVRTVIKDYTFQSLGELNALLSCYNIDMKHIRGEDKNKEYNGIVYSPTNDSGRIIGNPVKSSKISKDSGFKAITGIIGKTTARIKKDGLKAHALKNNILYSLKSTRDKAGFISSMKRHSVDVVFRQNEAGRIYGVTFIDHKNKIVCNGSRLGKEFSANMFDKYFDDCKKQVSSVLSGDIVKEDSGGDSHGLSHTVLVDDIFGSFYPGSVGLYAEEEEFIRRMKRKVKKKKSRNI